MVRRHLRRICIDLVLLPFAFYLALLIHFDGQCTAEALVALIRFTPVIVLTFIIVNISAGIYRKLWIHATLRDVVRLTETTALGTLLLILINVTVWRWSRGRSLPLGSLLIGGVCTLALSMALRYRLQLAEMLLAARVPRSHSNSERVLIVGTSDTALQLATQMRLRNNGMNYELVGFVMNDPAGMGMSLNGAEVVGTLSQIPAIVRERQIDVIVIACTPSDREERWQLISTCLETPAQVKVVPDITEMMQGGFKDPLTLRQVSITDILGRSPVSIQRESCEAILAGKVVLVTGAAGSIGSELCRQIIQFKPRLLLALDNNETGLFELNLELNPDGKRPVHMVVADVTDPHRLSKIFQEFAPHVIFHAAAYKHVPVLELHPYEALRVNVLGTVILSQMAHEYHTEHFVFVSTDKAVNPSSVMGAAKRIGELWIESLAEHSETLFTAVRFGNVVGSRGSVLPIFTRQIERGGPVTVTHPDMTRFFMSIPEAVSLLLQSVAFSCSGGIFMLEMGEEVSILSLVERMIRMKGLRVQKDLKIEFTGIRPGEKLHEELAYLEELKAETPHPKIYHLGRPCSLIDHETLLGLILILRRCAQTDAGEACIHDGLFQIAAGDVDGFLNQLAGFDLRRDWSRLPVGPRCQALSAEPVVGRQLATQG